MATSIVGKTLTSANGIGTVILLSFSTIPITVIKINVTTNETVSNVIDLNYNDGTATRLLGSYKIPAGAGTLGKPVANILEYLGDFSFSAGYLTIGMETTIASGKSVNIHIFY